MLIEFKYRQEEQNMAGISADLINPFLMAATSIMKDICQTDMSIGTIC